MSALPPDIFDESPPEGPRLDHGAYLLRLELLPKRQRRVAELMTLGMHTADIAAELGIQVNTVYNHLKESLKRLELSGGRDMLVAFLIWGIRRQ